MASASKRSAVCLALLLLMPALALADEAAPRVHADRTGPRFALRAAGTEAAPQRGDRYALRARFARNDTAGELREGTELILLGRLTKGGITCNGNSLFANGFEGN